MKLDILICCYNESIQNINNVLLSPREDVQYIVSHQYSDSQYSYIPDYLNRIDVKVVKSLGKGLAKNRNIALRNSTNEICLIADDDVLYTHQYIDTVIMAHKLNPDKDIIVFKIKTLENEPAYKFYPDESYVITENCSKHYISSIEITFKRSKIICNNIFFDERFGLGSRYFNKGREESVFIFDCLKKGLVIQYINKYIVKHPYMSTGKLFNSDTIDRIIKNELAFYFRTSGTKYFPRAILNYRFYYKKINVFKYLSNILKVIIILIFRKSSFK